MGVMSPPSLNFSSSWSIIDVIFTTYQANLKSTEEISCRTVWFCEEWVSSGTYRRWEIYHLKERAVPESNPTLHPPRADSQSCISGYITLRPAASLSPSAREPSRGERARRHSAITHRHSLTPALPRLYLISCSPPRPVASRSSRLLY